MCHTSIAQPTAPHVVRAHTMQPERTSLARLDVAGVVPPGFSGPYTVLYDSARESSSSNDLREAESGAAIDGASTAHRRQPTRDG
eukprot:6308738-Prymnesium_polylepis.1